MASMRAQVEEVPLQHSFFRDKVLVVCTLWRVHHSVYRNFVPYVRALQSNFRVRLLYCARSAVELAGTCKGQMCFARGPQSLQ